MEVAILFTIHQVQYAFQQNRVFKSKLIYYVTKRNEAKTLTKQISCVCKCKFYCRKYNLDQKWNNDNC